MTELHLPWLEMSIGLPLLGALVQVALRDPRRMQAWGVVVTGLTFLTTVAAWEDFTSLHVFQAHDHWDAVGWLLQHELFVVDELSAPLLPLVALLHVLTAVATLRTKQRRFSFGGMLVGEALTLALFSCREPWPIIVLLILGTLPQLVELRARGARVGAYLAHMILFGLLLVVGWWQVEREGVQRLHSWWAIAPLLGAIFIRTGIAPFHGWLVDLFEQATFGTALLVSTPVAGAYAAVRLVLPIASNSMLSAIGWVSITTAVYAACLACVQREARRFFCYVLLSHTALVLGGLELVGAESEGVATIGLTGALCAWLSIGLSLGGFGLTLRALEARRGRLVLDSFQGLYEHTPALAVCFLLTGLGSVGFPGTLGFIGTEMLIDATVQGYGYIGVAAVAAAALNGVAVVRAYFALFTGTRYPSSIALGIGVRERFAVLLLAGLILGGGIWPQPGVASRYHAARALLVDRNRRLSAAAGVTPPVVVEPGRSGQMRVVGIGSGD